MIRGLGDFAAIRDMSPHDCAARFGATLEPLPEVEIAPFVSSGEVAPGPSDEEIAELCGATPAAGEINQGAVGVNCPDLADYHLFADPTDPRSTPNGGGVPFVLNSKLFSDYAVKYRVAYLPPGEPALYRDLAQGENATFHFPVGTVLAKTFAFRDGDDERVVETRLLIKRQDDGEPAWIGLPYLWETDAEGKPVARLASGGAVTAASWDYVDADSGRRLAGSTDRYGVPHINQCITCHGNSDLEAGAPPVGPKPRNLNRLYVAESDILGSSGQSGFPAVNQLQDWRDRGLLSGGPADLGIDPATGIATAVERSPRWNVPGDSGFAADSHEDVEARVRAYLEVNCQHCHNVRGAASNTGLFLRRDTEIAKGADGARGASAGICKTPTAAGGGTGGRLYSIAPGDVSDSIMPFRMESNDTQARMPPLARSVAHDEAVDLLEEWIAGMDGTLYDGTDDDGACP